MGLTCGLVSGILNHMTTTHTTTNTTRGTLTEIAERDKYGRTVRRYQYADRTNLGVIVRLPKSAIAAGRLPYLCNNWTTREVVEHATLKAARAQIVVWHDAS